MGEPVMTVEEIEKYIPHRYPFLLVDRVLELEPGERILAIKNVTMNEPHFTGHFPGKPVMPGVLIVEAMAQASALMVAKSFADGKNRLVYFMTIDNTKFRKPVVPGDQVELHVKALQNRRNVWKCEGQAMVGGQKVAEAVFSAMVGDPVDG
jgi:3-hydroxyacyl-[acyl-carrier-protein] dehydratase